MDQATLIEDAMDVIRSKWPKAWGEIKLRSVPSETLLHPDALLELTPPGSEEPVRIVVEAKTQLPPREATSMANQVKRYMELLDADTGVIVSPWLSPRTQEAITETGLNYVDLTGNLSLILRSPPLALAAEGAHTDPAPQAPSVRGLGGEKGWMLARTLADVRPPYTVTELAEATDLSPSFVSRVLNGLEGEGIIDRARRGPVLQVDVRRLIERWTADYGLFDSNRYSTYVFPEGPRAFERVLIERGPERWALSGSLGAVRLAPIAAPSLAIVYVDRPAELARELELLPAESGANTILATPYDAVVYERRWQQEGAWFAAPSQLAADCLTGSGRMPNEGDALLAWMENNEDRWRAPSLAGPAPSPIG